MQKKIATDISLEQSLQRRTFISTSLKAALASALISLPGISMAGFASVNDLTIQQVIDMIIKDIPGAPFKETVDTIKSGSADNKVTGIVTTMFATVNVIKEAIQLNANFIIAHEPTFYNHTDDKKWTGENKVVSEKDALLAKHHITVWRFHDYIHSFKPDGVFYGVTKKAGWESYTKPGEPTFIIPAASLKKIAEHLKKTLSIDHVRVIGDLNKSCKKITLIPGSGGGQMQMKFAEKDNPDVLIVGEVHEWETAEYIRDARLLGHEISLVVLGHAVSEEPGMSWFVNWLQPKIPGTKVTHIASKSPFMWV